MRVVGRDTRGVFAVAVFVDRQRAEVDEVVRVLGIVGFVALALAAAGGWLVAGRVLAPVRELRRTAQTITETDFARRIPIRGRDEIAELARTFNGMLDRLQAAFAVQRAFVDDAGHELRTPITIIRGHLELLGADPVEREETVELVTDELDRMSRMVDDLLTLAKAERPDFLRPAPVDVEAFTVDLLARVTALAPRDWRMDEAGTGTVIVDRHRLTQAMVQLAQNATQHTRPGEPVSIGSRLRGRTAVFWVADSGPGVPATDRTRIFERFTRGQSGRGSSDGAGLGLAIVRAIALAHGGRVWVVGGDDDHGGDGTSPELGLGPGLGLGLGSDPGLGPELDRGGATFVLAVPRAGSSSAVPDGSGSATSGSHG